MTYVYRCGCGDQDHDFPMGTAPERLGACSECEEDVWRVFTPPAITYGPGVKPPWSDKIQRGSEEARRFSR